MLDLLCQRAAAYSECLSQRNTCCCEGPALPDELHLQALWQHPDLRPTPLALTDGTPVEILEVGRWNRAAGPDFQDAVITLGGILRRGDVELHLHPKDWDAHHHTDDPAYNDVILHVTWWDHPPAKTIPPGIPTLALQPFAKNVDFATLDVSTIPYAQNTSHPCWTRLQKTPGAVEQLLTSAGYFRLLTKTRRFIEGLRAEVPFQCFYEGLMGAMGYGNNAEPFRRLAKETPFTRIESFSTLQRFAALAGVAGLLKPAQRELWDLWWRSGLQPPIEPYTWTLRGTRPQNHPWRRLAGAVGILQSIDHLLACALDRLPMALSDASNCLREPLQLKGSPIGIARANAIVSNLFVPYRLALGTLHPDKLNDLPGEAISMPMRETWHRLTGTLRNLPKDGLRQQGLLQIYTDFCHNPRLTCTTCPLGN